MTLKGVHSSDTDVYTELVYCVSSCFLLCKQHNMFTMSSMTFFNIDCLILSCTPECCNHYINFACIFNHMTHCTFTWAWRNVLIKLWPLIVFLQVECAVSLPHLFLSFFLSLKTLRYYWANQRCGWVIHWLSCISIT